MAGTHRHARRLLVATVVAVHVALMVPAETSAQPMPVQAVPVIDLNGRLLGVEGWLADEAWLAYLGGGWEFADPSDPRGTEHDGLRFRLGLTIPLSGRDAFDMRVVHWPVSWLPGWDGTTGLMVSWQHPSPGGLRWKLGALAGQVWVRRELAASGLKLVSGYAPVRALSATVKGDWEMAPQLVAQPSLEAVFGAAGRTEGASGGSSFFGSLMGRLPFWAGVYRLELRGGFAWPPDGALIPAGSGLDSNGPGRLGFRAGGWPAEVYVRGAAPAGGDRPQRAALGLSLERRVELPALPERLRFWPDTRGYVLLFVDAGAVASSFSFSQDVTSRVGYGVAGGLTGRGAGELEAYIGISPEGGRSAVRLGLRWVPEL